MKRTGVVLLRAARPAGVFLLLSGLVIGRAGANGGQAGAPTSTIDFQTVGSGVSEVGWTNAVLNVVRIGSLQGVATVDYATSNGTAQAGLDFVGQSGTLIFHPGEQFQTITITGLDDTLAEGAETFTVVLRNPTGNAELGWNPVSYLIVSDNECTANLVDASFDPLAGPAQSATGIPYLYALGLQADGGIVVGGSFDRWNGLPRTSIARLKVDGSLDAGFSPVLAESARLNVVRIQGDGKILVAGLFASAGGLARTNLARFNTDGSVDPSFVASLPGITWPNALSIQADGKILVAGRSGPPEQVPPFVMRFTTNGVIDPGFVPPLFQPSDLIHSLAVQADQKLLVGGSFDQGNESVRRLNPNGSRDLSLVPPVNVGLKFAFGLTVQTDGKIIVGGVSRYDSSLPPIARLNPDGSIDPTFDVRIANQNSYATVQSLVVQPDDKVILGGSFFPIDGHVRFGIVRLNANGSEDPSFDPGSGINGEYPIVYAVAVQPDGRVLLAGSFDSVNTIPRASVARLLPDNGVNTLEFSFPEINAAEPGATFLTIRRCGNSGAAVSVDYSFMDGTASNGVDYVGLGGTVTFGPAEIEKTIPLTILNDNLIERNEQFRVLLSHPTGGAILGPHASGRVTILDNDHAPSNVDRTFADREFGNGVVNAMSLQPDGKVIIGGDLFLIEGGTLHDVGRLYPDGTPDPTFDPGPVIHTLGDEGVTALGLQPGGRVLFGGSFYLDPDGRQPGVARLHADGSLDTSFVANLDGASVKAIVVFPDGSFLVGGHGLEASSNHGLARWYADGSQDTNFVGTVESGNVDAISLDQDGRILVGGQFGSADGVPRFNLARLQSDGSLDPGFAPEITGGSGSAVLTIAAQNDGRILVGGEFDRVDGIQRKNIARLLEDGSIDVSFNPGLGTDFAIKAILVQPDGRIVLGGDFWNVDGFGSRALARLHADGSFDIGFAPQAAPAMNCTCLALQPDGKVLAGGVFCRAGPGDDIDEFEYCYGVVRLNPDPPLRLSPPQPLANGSMRLDPVVLPGRSYVLQATTDFVNWMPLTTNAVMTPLPRPVIDSEAGLYRQRFYRLRQGQ